MQFIDRLTGHTKRSRAAEIALWAGQGLLATMFLKAGSMKLVKPIAELDEKLGLPRAIGAGTTRFIGASEVAGGIGAILPAATRIAPWLTAVAAGALGVDMLLASGFHLGRGELSHLKVPIALAALAALVAYGRGAHKPIKAR